MLLPSQIAAGQKLPTSGTIFISMADKYKLEIVPIARELADLGYKLVATCTCYETGGDTVVPVQWSELMECLARARGLPASVCHIATPDPH